MSVLWGAVATSAHGEFEVMSDAQEPKSTTNFLQILGAPSSLTYACCALTQTMADTIHGDHVLIQAVFLDDVKNRWVTLDRTNPRPIVLISDCPSRF